MSRIIKIIFKKTYQFVYIMYDLIFFSHSAVITMAFNQNIVHITHHMIVITT